MSEQKVIGSIYLLEEERAVVFAMKSGIRFIQDIVG